MSIAGTQSELAQLKQDADRGDRFAMCQLADRFRASFDVRQDYAEALRWYVEAAVVTGASTRA